MPIDVAPHRPSEEERAAGRALRFPSDEPHARLTLEMVGLGFEQGQYAECLALLKPLVRVRPDDARIYESFGLIHQICGESKEARACFELAVELDDQRALSHLNLGELAWRKDRDAKRARFHLGRAEKAAPTLSARVRVTHDQIERAGE